MPEDHDKNPFVDTNSEPQTTPERSSEETATTPVAEPVRQQTVEAAPAPSVTPSQPTAESVHNSSGTLVLQWLTYAFWGWTALVLIWLTGLSLNFFISPGSRGAHDTETVAYSLAAVIVLFIISILCDLFYSRIEPLRKYGAAMVIMIIHAVIFALFGIGSLIVAVFAVVRLLIGDSSPTSYQGNEGTITILLTGLIMSVVYGAALLRTLRPHKVKAISKLYWLFMGLVVVSVTTLGIVGPIVYARETRDDRLIENALPNVSYGIQEYVATNKKLPASLEDIRDKMPESSQPVVDRNLVEYTPGKELPTETATGLSSPITKLPPSSQAPAYSYKLCVTYKSKKGSGSVRPVSGDSISPETYSHAAGRVCYDLVTSYSAAKYY